MIGAAKQMTVDFATLRFHWIRNPNEIPQVVNLIANSVTLQGGLLTYRYDGLLAEQLAQQVPAQPQLLPAQWGFSWGSESETTLLTNALALRCIYHNAAVHFGAGVNTLRGGGISNILLVISGDQLVEDIKSMLTQRTEGEGVL